MCIYMYVYIFTVTVRVCENVQLWEYDLFLLAKPLKSLPTSALMWPVSSPSCAACTAAACISSLLVLRRCPTARTACLPVCVCVCINACVCVCYICGCLFVCVWCARVLAACWCCVDSYCSHCLLACQRIHECLCLLCIQIGLCVRVVCMCVCNLLALCRWPTVRTACLPVNVCVCMCAICGWECVRV